MVDLSAYADRINIGYSGDQFDAHIHAGFRVTGQEREALKHPLSRVGFAWKCEYNGVSPDRAPWQYRYASNAAMRAYIEARAA